jgi:CHC2 zinc finger
MEGSTESSVEVHQAGPQRSLSLERRRGFYKFAFAAVSDRGTAGASSAIVETRGRQGGAAIVMIEDLLAKLQRVRKSGAGFVASCPVHQDRHPSLSIREVEGKILLHCFSHECSVGDICGAIGVEVRDLFTNPRSLVHRPRAVRRSAYIEEAVREFQKKLTPNERDYLDVTVILCSPTTIDQAAARAFVLAIEDQQLAVIVLKQGEGHGRKNS